MSPEREKERKKEKKMPFVVATYVYASSQGQRTHSARTKMPFVVATYVYVNYERLPRELLRSIFGYLKARDLINVILVSKS